MATEQTKVVPREPTPEMWHAGNRALQQEDGCPHDCWQAMFDATPAPVQGSGGEAIGFIDEGDDGAFVELYPDRNLPLNAKVYLHPPSPGSEGVEGAGEAKPHVNIGMVGHVDHGKVGLTAALTMFGQKGAGEQAGEVEVRVEPNRCKCHPETCCCPDSVLLIAGEVILSGSSERLDRVRTLIRQQASALAQARAERDAAREGWDCANGTAELAIKHRDEAEARTAAAVGVHDRLRGAILERLTAYRESAKLRGLTEGTRDMLRTVADELSLELAQDAARIDAFLAESGGEGGR